VDKSDDSKDPRHKDVTNPIGLDITEGPPPGGGAESGYGELPVGPLQASRVLVTPDWFKVKDADITYWVYNPLWVSHDPDHHTDDDKHDLQEILFVGVWLTIEQGDRG
jgi:hypothetical protein